MSRDDVGRFLMGAALCSIYPTSSSDPSTSRTTSLSGQCKGRSIVYTKELIKAIIGRRESHSSFVFIPLFILIVRVI